MIIISTIVATVLCAIFYRLGGMGKDGSEKYNLPLWLCNTKVRDLGIPIVGLIFMVMFIEAKWYWHIVSFMCLFGSLTTYWDEIFSKDNFAFHGLMIGLSYIFYGANVGTVRALIIAAFMGILCQKSESDWVEELGRGAIIGLTLPLMLIGG